MQQNGYYNWELLEAPDNGHLLSQTEWYDSKWPWLCILNLGIQKKKESENLCNYDLRGTEAWPNTVTGKENINKGCS